MKIHKVESRERKGDQQYKMVCNCINHWNWLNNADCSYYPKIMNMNDYRFNYEHDCWMALTYHFNPNKW